jgi:hypothetical protein
MPAEGEKLDHIVKYVPSDNAHVRRRGLGPVLKLVPPEGL